MTIDRVSNINLVQQGKNAGWTSQVNRTAQSDSISLSAEAVEKGDLYRATELVSSAADTRAERIAELKKKINDPSYINEAIINATADKIMDLFGL
ncbi:MAG: flagellar biosynthesis anti-sigma factor FlgM [Spirochaetaceae bacterium]|jgi:negative regulator of flagellin synthesis FlgM|nr:flagellar biosynthesis anti-sigma factor FlgM [Spirochaetaceae bacterium]